MNRSSAVLSVVTIACAATALAADAQATSPYTPAAFHRAAIELHGSTLGYGGDVATNITSRLNLVLSANGANYGYLDPSKNGVVYNLHYRPRNAELRFQMFPFSSPHTQNVFFTAGGVLTTHAWVTGKMTATPGALFSMNGTTYRNSTTDPMYGTVGFGSGRLAYTFGVGWGNMLRRSRRFAFPVEIGVIALGASHARVYPAGSVCDASGENCRLVSSDPTLLENQRAEAERVAGNHTALQYVPIVTVGVSYRFPAR